MINFIKNEDNSRFVNNIIKFPEPAYKGDAGLDIFAITNADCNSDNIIDLGPHEHVVLDTGIKAEIKDESLWLELRERSSMAKRGLCVLGGIIDTGYTGEIRVIVSNSTNKCVELDLNQACAQIIVRKHCDTGISFNGSIQQIKSKETRMDKGFGSSNS